MSHVESMKLSCLSLSLSLSVFVFCKNTFPYYLCVCSLTHNISCALFVPLCLSREKRKCDMKQSTLYARYHTDRHRTNYKKETIKVANAENANGNACITQSETIPKLWARKHSLTQKHEQKYPHFCCVFSCFFFFILAKMITSTCGVLIDNELTVVFRTEPVYSRRSVCSSMYYACVRYIQ